MQPLPLCSRTLSSIKKEILCSQPHFPPYSPAPGNHESPFYIMDLPILDISHEWDHIIYIALCAWFLLLRIKFSRFIQVLYYISVLHSFIMNEQSYIVWIYHIHCLPFIYEWMTVVMFSTFWLL